MRLNLSTIHPSWLPLVKTSLMHVNEHYMQALLKNPNWLPGPHAIFNAFHIPLEKTRYILFGESPYPRQVSANGYAFWDADVHALFSPTGLSKPVNRATSLRHIIKMLLVCESLLSPTQTSQTAIAATDKSHLVQTLDELFQNFLAQGFLLLNASLVFSEEKVSYHAKMWHPFMTTLLTELAKHSSDIQLILLGNVAKQIKKIPAAATFPCLEAEHPYNISFISNPNILNFFKSLHLLQRKMALLPKKDYN